MSPTFILSLVHGRVSRRGFANSKAVGGFPFYRTIPRMWHERKPQNLQNISIDPVAGDCKIERRVARDTTGITYLYAD